MALVSTVLLLVISAAFATAEKGESCISGHLMDFYCIERGTLLDSPSHKTLENPEEHSVHCLVDVPPCYNSAFELLRPLQGQENQYCRAFRLDEQGKQTSLELARSIGRPGGCSTCSGNGTQDKGLIVTITGTIGDEDVTPRIFNVRKVEHGSVPCPDELRIDEDLCSNGTVAGPDFTPVWTHGSLMIVSWGFLLPSGALIALFQRHRDPLWFQLHRGVQSGGLLLALIGVTVAAVNFDVWSGANPTAVAHGWAGVVVMVLGVLQPVNAFFRPHKVKDQEPTRSRILWEWLHKGVGYGSLVLALGVIYVGTNLAGIDVGDPLRMVFFALLFVVLLLGAGLFIDSRGARRDSGGEAETTEMTSAS